MSICSWFKNLKKKPEAEVIPIKPIETPLEPGIVRDLSWKQPGWSKFLVDSISNHFHDSLVKASDWDRIHPNFSILTRDAQIYVMAELIAAMAYYESAWNPKSASQDVGTAADKDTWSIGLLQLSVCDQKNMGIDLNYNYSDLLLAPPNLHLGLLILARQVKKTGLIILPNKHPQRYWAVLLDGNKYSKVDSIIARVRKYAQ